jgi:hypothetical protein
MSLEDELKIDPEKEAVFRALLEYFEEGDEENPKREEGESSPQGLISRSKKDTSVRRTPKEFGIPDTWEQRRYNEIIEWIRWARRNKKKEAA